MAIAHVNGVDLYYETIGRGERIVLTHGAWGDGRSWQAVVGPLAAEFEVVTWDRRGHSRSGGREGPGSYHEDASDLAALIEHLGPGRTHVHGNSSGGTIVLRLVAERPDLLASASVHEPAVDAFVDRTDRAIADDVAAMETTIETVNDSIRSGDHAGGARAFIEMVVGPGAWEQTPRAIREAWIANAPAWLDESGHQRTADIAALAASSVPLMLSHGTVSPAVEKAPTLALIHELPRARVEVLKGAGPVPYRTLPDLWLACLRSFLHGLTPVEPASRR
jgi:pimeloyl-ACP methyl ester carboxylesterase